MSIPPRKRCGRPRPAGVLPLRLRRQNVTPTARQPARSLLGGVQAGEEYLNVVPAHLLHGAVRVVRNPLARRGAQTVAVPRHHRLVLGLRHLVLAQIKALGEGYVRASSSLRIHDPLRSSGLPIAEGSGFHPDHFHDWKPLGRCAEGARVS